MTDEIALPHSEATEAALVARLLVDPAVLPTLRLEPVDFFVPAWAHAFAGMRELSQARKTVDIVALRNLIGPDADELGRRVGEVTAAYRAPVEEYAEIIRGFAFRRKLIAKLGQVEAQAYVVDDREALLSSLHEKVVEITAGIEDGRLVTPGQAVDAYLRQMEERARGERLAGLTWGLRAMDNLLLPAQGGEMIVIAARPSVGKTALAETTADHWAKTAPFPVLFVSLEMSMTQLLDRTMSRESGVVAHDIVRGILKEEDTERVAAAAAGRRGVGLWYLDNPFATTNDVRAAAAKLRVQAGGISGIVVDYLQLLKDNSSGQMTEVQRVTGISRNLKGAAREFDCPLIVLSQLNRSVTARDDQRPRLHDLRESGAIEQDADRVIALTRSIGAAQTGLEVLKARQGPVGSSQLFFDADHVRFVDVLGAPVIESSPDEQRQVTAVPQDAWAATTSDDEVPY